MTKETASKPAALARNGKPEKAPMDTIETATAVGLLKQLYHEAQTGLRRVVAFGLCCYEVKERIPHGKFGPWLKEHCPDISWRTVQTYMQLSAGVLENCGLQIKDFLQMRSSCAFAHGGEILLLPDGKVPEDARPIREKICRLIDGKSARQLFLEFKTAEDDGDAKVVVRNGGGDRIWDSFIREKHPELIVNGRVPKRGQVEQSVRDELAQNVAKQVARSPEDLAADTRTVLEEWVQVTRRLIANKDLPHLMPQEFGAALSVLEMLRDRFKTLQGRFRQPRGRKAKKFVPKPGRMPAATVHAIKDRIMEGRKNTPAASPAALLKGSHE